MKQFLGQGDETKQQLLGGALPNRARKERTFQSPIQRMQAQIFQGAAEVGGGSDRTKPAGPLRNGDGAEPR